MQYYWIKIIANRFFNCGVVVCGAQKFVCTTVQPTELPYGELYDWQGAADFVADYLNFIPLEPPHELVSIFVC